MNFKDIINKYLKKQDVDEKVKSGFAVRFFDPANKKRFAVAYPDKKDADDKAAQLKRDGLKDITITKHDLNFKEDVSINEILNPKIGDKLKHKFKNVNYDVEIVGVSDNAQIIQLKFLSSGPEKGRLITVSRDKIKEESPANATGTAVAGSGDDSSTVVVKKKKELQSKLMKRLKIKESIDKAIPDLVEEEDDVTKRKNQLKELAKNNA